MVKNKVKLLEAVLKYVGQPTPRPLPSPIFSTLHTSINKGNEACRITCNR